jgi:hypothetical protein
MLGVTTYDQDTPADLLMKEYAQENGFGETYTKTRVGVFIGEEGRTVPDPFFGGEGPERTGCVRGGARAPRRRRSDCSDSSSYEHTLCWRVSLGVERNPCSAARAE